MGRRRNRQRSAPSRPRRKGGSQRRFFTRQYYAMNYQISNLVPIIGADEDTLRDAARIMGYRIVGSLLCFSGKIPVPFIQEAHDLQRMKDAARRRAQARRAA